MATPAPDPHVWEPDQRYLDDSGRYPGDGSDLTVQVAPALPGGNQGSASCGKSVPNDRIVVDKLINASNWYKKGSYDECCGFNWPTNDGKPNLRSVTNGGPWRPYVVRMPQERGGEKVEKRHSYRWKIAGALSHYDEAAARRMLLDYYKAATHRIVAVLASEDEASIPGFWCTLRFEVAAMFAFAERALPLSYGIPECSCQPRTPSCQALRTARAPRTCQVVPFPLLAEGAEHINEFCTTDLFLLAMSFMGFLYRKRTRKGPAQMLQTRRGERLVDAERAQSQEHARRLEAERLQRLQAERWDAECNGPEESDLRKEEERLCLQKVKGLLLKAKTALQQARFFGCESLFLGTPSDIGSVLHHLDGEHGICQLIELTILQHIDASIPKCRPGFEAAEVLATRYAEIADFLLYVHQQPIDNQPNQQTAIAREMMREAKRVVGMLEDFLREPDERAPASLSLCTTIPLLFRSAHMNVYDSLANVFLPSQLDFDALMDVALRGLRSITSAVPID